MGTSIELPSGLHFPKPLRSYQWQGVQFLLERNSALLADQMGLGKSVQVAIALSIMFRLGNLNRALLVVPASLKLNWERELTYWAPDLSIRRLLGDVEDRFANYHLPIHILIASYEQIRADALELSNEVCFEVVVLDEAQRIKNSDSDTALACRILQRKRSWALTGTPIENRVSDLLSIYRFVYPGLLSASMNRSEMLERMRPFYLRRRKTEVLSELPPIITQDIFLELSGQQKEAYDRMWATRHLGPPEGIARTSEMQIFALITKLKQLCNFDPESGESVKLDALRVIVEELSSAADKLIVFSQYVETLKWIQSHISDQISCEVFHGGLSESAKDEMLTRFRHEPGPRVLLMSLIAAGTGLNLQEATSVLLFDRWWNPAMEEQAIHRAHRFGRQGTLEVFRFLVEDSIEDRIAEVLAEKKDLIDNYIEAADVAVISSLSRSDFLRILSLDEA